MEDSTEMHHQVSNGPPHGSTAILTHGTAAASLQDTASLLRYVYADLRRLSQVASPTVTLHPADRSLSTPAKDPIRGIDAVQAHEARLSAAAGGTIRMEVHGISANEHFGAVLGTLQARGYDHRDGQAMKYGAGNEDPTAEEISMPFCGLWRFVDGKVVEHWENAADPARLADWLAANDRRQGSMQGSQ